MPHESDLSRIRRIFEDYVAAQHELTPGTQLHEAVSTIIDEQVADLDDRTLRFLADELDDEENDAWLYPTDGYRTLASKLHHELHRRGDETPDGPAMSPAS